MDVERGETWSRALDNWTAGARLCSAAGVRTREGAHQQQTALALSATCHLPACRLPPATCRLSPIAYRLSPAASCRPPLSGSNIQCSKCTLWVEFNPGAVRAQSGAQGSVWWQTGFGCRSCRSCGRDVGASFPAPRACMPWHLHVNPSRLV